MKHGMPGYGRSDPFPCSGDIEFVSIEPGPHPPDRHANRPEREAQRD